MSASLILHKFTRSLPTGEQILAHDPKILEKRHQAERFKTVCQDIATKTGHTQVVDLTVEELRRLVDVYAQIKPTRGQCQICNKGFEETDLYTIRRATQASPFYFCKGCIVGLWWKSQAIEDLEKTTRTLPSIRTGEFISWPKSLWSPYCDACNDNITTDTERSRWLSGRTAGNGSLVNNRNLAIVPRIKEAGDPTEDWEDFDFRYAIETKVWYFVHPQCLGKLPQGQKATEKVAQVQPEQPSSAAPKTAKDATDKALSKPVGPQAASTCGDSEWSETETERVTTPESTVLGDAAYLDDRSVEARVTSLESLVKKLIGNQRNLMMRAIEVVYLGEYDDLDDVPEEIIKSYGFDLLE